MLTGTKPSVVNTSKCRSRAWAVKIKLESPTTTDQIFHRAVDIYLDLATEQFWSCESEPN